MKKITFLILSLMIVLPLSITPVLASSGDTVAPSRPVNLNALVASTNQINLNWTASTDNVGVVGYNIYNKNNLIGTSTSTNFSSLGLTPNTKHKYRVRAFDAAGNLSVKSGKITAITLSKSDTITPSVPSNLTASVYSSKQINLDWANSTDNSRVVTYSIYRNNILIATSTKSKFSDINLAPSTLYTYNISSFDSAGNVSARSVSILATTLAPDTISPSAPTGVMAVINNFKNRVILSWKASTDNVGVTSYRIIRNGLVLGDTHGTNYVDKAVATSTAYSYAVLALDADGNTSVASTIASVTTPAKIVAPVKKAAMEIKKINKIYHKIKVVASQKNSDNKKFGQNNSNHNEKY